MRQNHLVNRLKTAAFKAFVTLVKPLWGKGFGRIPPIGAVYKYLYRSLAAKELVLQVQGGRMITRASVFDGIANELLYRSGYEQYETKLFRQYVTADMTVVDIGANVGYYTLLAAKLVGAKGKVFAFEPEPENYALLVRNIKMNGYKNAIPERKAVSNKTGKANLFLNKETGAHGLLSDREGIIGTMTVETVSLDEYFKGKEHPIDIIKIDVEGAELAVLRGMQNIIKNNADLKIFTELFWPVGLHKSDFSPREYWDRLVEIGFKCIYFINEQEQRLETADFSLIMRYCEGAVAEKFLSPNLLCAKSPLKASDR
ncbi:MAG: FkbM family methyltransferase [Chloroflexota bacterium]|nr:MAG: FkbM family methyltransferase [Chloroflexota bacterium]